VEKMTRVTNAAAIRIRPAEERDRLPLAELFAAVAEERDGIATEPPVDIEARAARWRLDGSLVAVDGDEIVGSLFIDTGGHGYGEIGMTVARDWRGRGVGSELMAAARRAEIQSVGLISISPEFRLPDRSLSASV